MSRRRFIAPARGEVEPARFDHPIHAGYAGFRHWLTAPAWPGLDTLNAALPLPERRFIEQTRAVLDDGLHYETRIAERGRIATRARNWHDLFNAMIWCRWPAIKQALNARQCLHIAAMGPRQRNRAQYALTQFDEAGVIVRLREPSLLSRWDAHDWPALFHRHAEAWKRGDIAIAAVIGHALLEHALVPAQFVVGKALVVRGEGDDAACVARIAGAIERGECLDDPLELRPLPLSGVPGWHPGQTLSFYEEAACFQPVREGRRYPPPCRLEAPGRAGGVAQPG
ncbi:DUF3025 domain-containing protein [Lysobacter pythonis]|uniref:DUF3025 domain-containing protein n=1 Tax=Solilutibacter pythonis TaxID=2483112 RepID=A0A3M2I934_9GAMM|nr:DUF3025 domain-containing protein [Lysobacter pythonis]RMH94977.1 DUF3025 domain-containing protein [Lysobacter pythonis]